MQRMKTEGEFEVCLKQNMYVPLLFLFFLYFSAHSSIKFLMKSQTSLMRYHPPYISRIRSLKSSLCEKKLQNLTILRDSSDYECRMKNMTRVRNEWMNLVEQSPSSGTIHLSCVGKLEVNHGSILVLII